MIWITIYKYYILNITYNIAYAFILHRVSPNHFSVNDLFFSTTDISYEFK